MLVCFSAKSPSRVSRRDFRTGNLPYGSQARKPLSYATPHYATPQELRHTPKLRRTPRATSNRMSSATPHDLRHTPKSYATPHYKLISVKHLLPGPCPLQCRIPMGRRGWAAGCPRLECSSALPSINRSSRVTCTTSHLRVQQLIRPIERGWRAAHPLQAEGRVGP
jgi:hypothetical protein